MMFSGYNAEPGTIAPSLQMVINVFWRTNSPGLSGPEKQSGSAEHIFSRRFQCYLVQRNVNGDWESPGVF